MNITLSRHVLILSHAEAVGFSGREGSKRRMNLWTIALAASHDICCPLSLGYIQV